MQIDVSDQRVCRDEEGEDASICTLLPVPAVQEPDSSSGLDFLSTLSRLVGSSSGAASANRRLFSVWIFIKL